MIIVAVKPYDIPAVIRPVKLPVHHGAVYPKLAAQLRIRKGDTLAARIAVAQGGVRGIVAARVVMAVRREVFAGGESAVRLVQPARTAPMASHRRTLSGFGPIL